MAKYSQLLLHVWIINFLFIVSFVCVSSIPGRRLKSRQKHDDGRSLGQSDVISTVYMSNHCREMVWSLLLDTQYVSVNKQMYLMMHPLADIEQSQFYVRKDCVATFVATSDYQLLIHFLDIAIDDRQQYLSRLHIYNGDTTNIRMTPYHGLYGEMSSTSANLNNLAMMDYVSIGQALTLRYIGNLSKRFYGFKAVLTPIKRPNRNGSCPSQMFQCVVSKFCIDTDLLCNGVPNCGQRDTSDEAMRCTAKSYQLTDANMDDLGLMIGCGVSILILLLAVIWVAVMCQKRHRLRRQRRQLNYQQGQDENAEEEHSRWLPRSFCDHVVPWVLREPPPPYNESVQPDQVPADFDLPPPYAIEANDHRSLVSKQLSLPGYVGEPLNAGANIIVNRRVVPSAPEEDPPCYEESTSPTPNLVRLLLAARHEQPRVDVNHAAIAEMTESGSDIDQEHCNKSHQEADLNLAGPDQEPEPRTHHERDESTDTSPIA